LAKRIIYWTKTALEQRNFIFSYWNDKNKSTNYSKRLLLLINARSNSLVLFPKIGKQADFKNTHVISIEHFSLFYQLFSNKIIIIAFWDNRRDPKELLDFLGALDKNK